VSESGNHDNNIYNENWSEQYHGLKVIAKKDDKTKKTTANNQDGAEPDEMPDSTFSIHVPTTVDLAANLKGNLLLETGDMDNNVHPANTIRLVHALIKANKRFDFMLLPGKPHGYGDMVPYTNHLMFEYFAEHLLGDYYRKDAAIR
jgi:dipeptidyl-peptidase 4